MASYQNYTRKYYESQNEVNWSSKKQEFESKMSELRQIKVDIDNQKKAYISPRNSLQPNLKTLEDFKIVLALKEEENLSLHHLLSQERERCKNLQDDIKHLSLYHKELENKARLAQSSISEKDQLLFRSWQEISSLKVTAKRWMNPNISEEQLRSGLSSPKILQSHQLSLRSFTLEQEYWENITKKLQNQLVELQRNYEISLKELQEYKNKEKNSDKLSEYLALPRESPADDHEKLILLHENELLKHELDEKNRQILNAKEEFEVLEEQFRLKICQIEDEHKKNTEKVENISREAYDKIAQTLQNQLKDKESELAQLKRYNQTEEYKNNIKILSENNALLQEKIKILEKDKNRIANEHKFEAKCTAQDFCNILLEKTQKENSSKAQAKEALCHLLCANAEIFAALLVNIFGKDCKGLFLIMQEKIESLEKELQSYKHNVSLLNGFERNSFPKKINFQNLTPKKASNSMSQDSLMKLMPRRSHIASKSFSAKKAYDETSNSLMVLENLVTEISESEKLEEKKSRISNFDLLCFLRCSTSALEDYLLMFS